MDMYEVTTTKSKEPVYILAENIEEAAWKASQVSGGVNYLKNVTLHSPNYINDESISEQLGSSS